MKASLKKQIERNIRELVSVGTSLPASARESGEPAGALVITFVSREEIRGRLEGASFGWGGFETSFRVPELTQRGGNLKLSPESIVAAA